VRERERERGSRWRKGKATGFWEVFVCVERTSNSIRRLYPFGDSRFDFWKMILTFK
jgi:hypothetical protein